jgi:putative hydrolase of the HAD superfamily
MLNTQHYSFDLWQTLLRSNPLFRKERSCFIRQKFAFHHLEPDAISQVFSQVDQLCNTINERSGLTIAAEEMYLLVLDRLTDHRLEELGDFDVYALYRSIEAIVMEYPPLPFSDKTLTVLEAVKKKATTNLLCNTGFLKGETLRKVLDKNGIGQHLDFQLYSEEERLSKPNPAFFLRLIDQLNYRFPDRIIRPNEILHIGDNPVTDIGGAVAVGMRALLVHHPSVSTDLEHLLQND